MDDIESLLAATTQDPPCGPNLEYGLPFINLMTAARGKPEQQMGNSVIPAEMPDWGDLRQQAESLLARSKDLRIAMVLLRALTRIESLPGLRRGLSLLHGLLERYWEQVHPVPDPEDPEDMAIRINALALLNDTQSVLSDVRCALVVPSGPHGRVSVRDVLQATGKIMPAAGDTVVSYQQIENAIGAAAASSLPQLQAASDCVRAIEEIAACLSARAGAQWNIDFASLLSLLKPVAQLCGAAASQLAVPLPAGVAAPEEIMAAHDAVAPMPTLSLHAAGQIRDRDDAMRMLEAVCRYYEQAEPGNPAPLLIRRAQRLMTKNFVEIMQDLAPDSLDQIRHIAGLKNEEA